MFANRFTAFIDACSLASVLRRDLLLSLAEADFFRLRWSSRVLDETQRAIEKIRTNKGQLDAAEKAAKARSDMARAFEDAMVTDFDHLLLVADQLPDQNDAHVLAAAIKTQASMIVTENLKDFPATVLAKFNIEAKSADAFIADTIALDEGRAVAEIRKMRDRYKNPELSADALLLKMEAAGLIETVDLLRDHVESL